MKIAMISSGSSIHVKKIANAMAERGHQIRLYTLPNNNKLLMDFDQRIEIIKLPWKGKAGYLLNAPFIRKDLKKNSVDLVNAHYASGYGTLARLVGKHPCALAVFGSDVYEYPFKTHFNMCTIRNNLDFADVLTSTSHVMADQVKTFYHRNKHIYVTPFGVDLKIFHPQEKPRNKTFIFGIVKKIEPKYGIDILIRAYKKFCCTYPDDNTKLLIYGTGSAVGEYKRLAADLGLSDSVSFMGFIKNELVPEALSEMDVAVYSSSSSESFGVAVVEAMACGVPVIASDASGFTEVMEEGKTGLLFPKKDVDALYQCMVKMYVMDPQERKRMGEAGAARVREYYDFDQNMDTYEEIMIKAVKM